MNAEIDGVISPEEKLVLRKRLDSDPAAVKFYHGLCKATSMLDAEEDLEPPESLKENILREIFGPSEQIIDDRKITSLGKRFKEMLSWNRRYAYGFTTGLVAGALILAAVLLGIDRGISIDLADFYAAVGIRENNIGKIDDLFQFVDEDISGIIRSSFDTDRLVAKVEISSRSQLELVFDLAGSTRITGLACPGKGLPEFESSGKRLKIVHKGDSRYLVTFASGPEESPEINFSIFRGGRMVSGKKFPESN